MRGTLTKIKGDGYDHTQGGLACTIYQEPTIGRSVLAYDDAQFGRALQTSRVTAVRNNDDGFEFDTLNSTYQFIYKEAA